MWEGPYWEGVWPSLDPWDLMRLRTSSSWWNDPGKYGPHSELVFFFVRNEPVALTQAVPFEPFVSADTLKACALIGPSPDSGDMWKYGCPGSPDWDSDVESGTESEGTSSSEQCEHNVESLALNITEQAQSREKISLFVEDWELAQVALSCRNALDLLCQLSQWTGCDTKGEGCGERV